MSFEQFDFESNTKWKAYFNSVELVNPSPENIEKLKKKWYKKEIVWFPIFPVISILGSQLWRTSRNQYFQQ
jgi:hypothetical protein